MSNIFDSLKLIKIVGQDDLNKLIECFRVCSDIEVEVEKFPDEITAAKHIMTAANDGFNLIYKHREAYKKYTELDVDSMLQGFHGIELAFEAVIDRQ